MLPAFALSPVRPHQHVVPLSHPVHRLTEGSVIDGGLALPWIVIGW